MGCTVLHRGIWLVASLWSILVTQRVNAFGRDVDYRNRSLGRQASRSVSIPERCLVSQELGGRGATNFGFLSVDSVAAHTVAWHGWGLLSGS